jgi:hypothetical protein
MLKLGVRVKLCILVVFLLITVNAEASVSLSVSATACSRDSDSNPYGCMYTNDYSELGTGASIISVSAYATDPIGNSSGLANARATYGKLGIYNVDPSPGYTNTDASFTDSWTITNNALNGSKGYIYFTASLEGIITNTARTSVILRLYDGDGNQKGRLDFNSLGVTGAPGLSTGSLGSISFTFGQPFELSMDLLGATANGGTIYLYDTAWISALTLKDSSGNVITDYQLTAASGQTYPIATPIPPALLLLGSGLIGLIGVRRFRK